MMWKRDSRKREHGSEPIQVAHGQNVGGFRCGLTGNDELRRPKLLNQA
jgi:hypothetical protein